MRKTTMLLAAALAVSGCAAGDKAEMTMFTPEQAGQWRFMARAGSYGPYAVDDPAADRTRLAWLREDVINNRACPPDGAFRVERRQVVHEASRSAMRSSGRAGGCGFSMGRPRTSRAFSYRTSTHQSPMRLFSLAAASRIVFCTSGVMSLALRVQCPRAASADRSVSFGIDMLVSPDASGGDTAGQAGVSSFSR